MFQNEPKFYCCFQSLPIYKFAKILRKSNKFDRSMPICYADSKEKIQNILDNSGGIAVLDFCTKTCDDCTKLDPYAEQLNLEKNIPLIKIDIDQAKDLKECCNIKGAPCFSVVREKWDNVVQCKDCHDRDQVLQIFNTAVECRNNLGKFK